MTDTYLTNQNISNNIIINKQKQKKPLEHKEKKPIFIRASFESYTSYDGENNETIDNRINDSFSSLTFDDISQNEEEDIDHLQKFRQEKKKIPLPSSNKLKSGSKAIIKNNNKNKNFNKVTVSTLTVENNKNFGEQEKNKEKNEKQLNRAISGNIIPLPKKQKIINTNNVQNKNSTNAVDDFCGYKRAVSGDRINYHHQNRGKSSKYNFKTENVNNNNNIHRKTATNIPLQLNELNKLNPNIIINNRKITSKQNKNMSIQTAKVTKLPSEIINKKDFSPKNNDIFKVTNYHSVNHYSGNLNKNLNLAPGVKNQINVINNLNVENKENLFVNNSHKSNNIKIIKNNNITNSNNTSKNNSDSPKNINKNISNLNHSPISNFELINRINNPNDKDIKNNNNINYNYVHQRKTNAPKNMDNSYSYTINKDIDLKNLNITQRLTVPPKFVMQNNNIEKNNQNRNYSWVTKNIQIYNQPSSSIHINEQVNSINQMNNQTQFIDFNQNLEEIHLNNPEVAIAKKISAPVPSISDNNIVQNIRIINPTVINDYNSEYNKYNNNNFNAFEQRFTVVDSNPKHNNLNDLQQNHTDINNFIAQNTNINNVNNIYPVTMRNTNIKMNNNNISNNQIINSIQPQTQQRNTIAAYTNISQLNTLNTINNAVNMRNFQDNQRLTQIPTKNTNHVFPQNQNKIINNNLNINKDLYQFDTSGRLKNYGILSLAGKDISGKQKTNQDSFVFKGNINKVKDFNIFGVLDGHGPEGHYVSKYASECITSYLINHPEIIILSDTEKIYQKLKENNCKIITDSFVNADQKLKTVNFDAFESGSTCVLVIHIGTHIICANTGDSRAIVVFDEKNDNQDLDFYFDEPLSRDFKPEIPEETNRILMSGGVVRQMKNEYGEGVGPYRVYIRGGDYPGLAMSRSIGDLRGKTIGVIPDPGILEYDLNEKTKYIVVCSDGVWEFLDNITVREMGKKHYINNNPNGYCHNLVYRALHLWEENDSVVDDITAVVAFF